jgi:hypothetical protein
VFNKVRFVFRYTAFRLWLHFVVMGRHYKISLSNRGIENAVPLSDQGERDCFLVPEFLVLPKLVFFQRLTGI